MASSYGRILQVDHETPRESRCFLKAPFSWFEFLKGFWAKDDSGWSDKNEDMETDIRRCDIYLSVSGLRGRVRRGWDGRRPGGPNMQTHKCI
jgi:hypothetical protein